MSTSVFPTSLDTYTNPTATNPTNSPSLSAGQTLQNDALAALESKVGIDSSAVTTTLDYKVKNAASPINSAITALQQNTTTLYADTGSVNAYAITPFTSIGAYASGQTFAFTPANTNTGASTLNVNALGTKAVQYQGQALFAGQMIANAVHYVRYDGTQFQLQNPATLLVVAKAVANQTVTSSSPVQVTSLSVTINVPAGRTVSVEAILPNVSNSATSFMDLSIWDGTVGSGTQVAKSELYSSTATGDYTLIAKAFITGVSGAKTYNVGLSSASGTLVSTAASTAPAYFTAEIK